MDKFLLEQLKASSKNIFNLDDIYVILGIHNIDKTTQHLTQLVLRELVKNKLLFRPRKNIYTLDKDYSRKELVCKLYRDTYISFETILSDQGIINHNTQVITAACYVSRKVSVGKDIYVYRELKKEILENNMCIDSGNFRIATKERAFLDMLYVDPKFNKFKNLQILNKSIIKKLLPIYQNNSLQERVFRLLSIKISHR